VNTLLPPDRDEENLKKIKTKVDLDKAKRKELAENEIYFDNVDKVGPDYIRQVEDAKVKLDKRIHYDILTAFQAKRQFNSYYNMMLAEYGQRLLRRINWPQGWKFDCIHTMEKQLIRIYGRQYKGERGVLVILKSPESKVFIRGIKSVYMEMMDIHAIEVLAEQAENTLDQWKGILLDKSVKKTASGIILPS